MNEEKSILAVRINQMRKDLDLTQEKLAIRLGLKGKSSIANYESGNIIPSDDIKLKMCKIFNCSMDYLMGKSEFKTMSDEYSYLRDYFYDEFGVNKKVFENSVLYPEELSTKELNTLKQIDKARAEYHKNNTGKFDISPYLSSLNNIEKEHVTHAYKLSLLSALEAITTIRNKVNLTNKQYYMCPVYGRISAGIPNWAEECIEGRLPIDPVLFNIINPEEHFFLRVNGESMNKVVRNGAYALIHKQDIVENGEIAVVLVNGDEATLKKFTKHGEVVVLEPMSNDDSFQTQIYDKTTPIKILGKYIGKFEMNK